MNPPLREGRPAPDLGDLGGKLRAERERLGWSISELGGRASVAASTVYKVETGAMTPSVLILARLASALGRRVGFFLGEEGGGRSCAMSRARGRRRLVFTETRFSGERLTAGIEEGRLHASWLKVERGGASSPAPLKHPGEELVVCLRGRVEFRVGGEVVVLGPGDSIQYRATLPHAWRNLHAGASEMIYVLTPPPVALESALHGTAGEVAATLLDPASPGAPS